MGKTITKVIRVDNNTKKLMCDFYQDMLRPKTPPYAIFQADTGDTIVTLYESGKAMFQGVSADIEASLWTSIEKDKDNLSYNRDICNACGATSNVHRIQGGYAKYCNKCIEKFGLIKVEDYD